MASFTAGPGVNSKAVRISYSAATGPRDRSERGLARAQKFRTIGCPCDYMNPHMTLLRFSWRVAMLLAGVRGDDRVFFTIESGAEFCEEFTNEHNQSCVHDGPGLHGSLESCTMRANGNLYATASLYAVESPYDYIAINGWQFTTTSPPINIPMNDGDPMTWCGRARGRARAQAQWPHALRSAPHARVHARELRAQVFGREHGRRGVDDLCDRHARCHRASVAVAPPQPPRLPSTASTTHTAAPASATDAPLGQHQLLKYVPKSKRWHMSGWRAGSGDILLRARVGLHRLWQPRRVQRVR